ncbi:MAG TPA: hypothetical protein VEU62_13250 [Bryobacterales bacterium]|nr:hypothetical protein [Bryobacterales bacterium]
MIRFALWCCVFPAVLGPLLPAAPGAPPDFNYFVQNVAPIFLRERSGGARCYNCHSLESNESKLHLQPLPPSGHWSEADLRKNYESVLRVIDRSDPLNSRLLRHPLAREAGGDRFHTGGKFWTSRDDPEWRAIKAWIEGAKAPAEKQAAGSAQP